MAIVDKLKSLYVKLGGDEKESASNINEWLAKINDKLGGDREGYPSNIEDWIDKIEDVASSGGASDGSSINWEWTSLISERKVDFSKNGQYYSATISNFDKAWEPQFANTARLLINGELIGVSGTSYVPNSSNVTLFYFKDSNEIEYYLTNRIGVPGPGSSPVTIEIMSSTDLSNETITLDFGCLGVKSS